MKFQQMAVTILASLIGSFASEALAIAIVAADKIAKDPKILTNSDRRRQLIQELKWEIPKLKDSVINLLAELAVQVLKTQGSPNPVPASTT